jgi:hypothetical protein
LSQFCRLNNPPAVPKALPPEQLAHYEGRYVARLIPPDSLTGQIVEQVIELKAANGGLRVTGDSETSSVAFYRDEYVLATDPQGQTNRIHRAPPRI